MRRPDGETIYLEWSVASKIEPGVSMVVATDVSQRVTSSSAGFNGSIASASRASKPNR